MVAWVAGCVSFCQMEIQVLINGEKGRDPATYSASNSTQGPREAGIASVHLCSLRLRSQKGRGSDGNEVVKGLA